MRTDCLALLAAGQAWTRERTPEAVSAGGMPWLLPWRRPDSAIRRPKSL